MLGLIVNPWGLLDKSEEVLFCTKEAKMSSRIFGVFLSPFSVWIWERTQALNRSFPTIKTSIPIMVGWVLRIQRRFHVRILRQTGKSPPITWDYNSQETGIEKRFNRRKRPSPALQACEACLPMKPAPKKESPGFKSFFLLFSSCSDCIHLCKMECKQ